MCEILLLYFQINFLHVKYKIFQAIFFNFSIPIAYFLEIEDIRMHFYKRGSIVGRICIKREIMNQKGKRSWRGWIVCCFEQKHKAATVNWYEHLRFSVSIINLTREFFQRCTSLVITFLTWNVDFCATSLDLEAESIAYIHLYPYKWCNHL